MEPYQTDYELARGARDGDSEALVALVERHRHRLFALAYARLRHYEDAQDAVAAALLRICRHVGQLRQPEQMASWMFSVVRNEAIRLRQHRPAWFSREVPEDAEAPDAPAQAAILRTDIERALRHLPADQARALALHHLANVPVRDIARRLGRPEGTIKYWLSAGRKRLIYHLEGYAPMEEREWTATIVSTEIEPDTLQHLADALRNAGYDTVNLLSDYRAAGRLEETGTGEAKELHLPRALRGTDMLVLDERIDGRSGLELHTALRATAEARSMATAILLNRTDEETMKVAVFAAWSAGFDVCLTKPVDPVEFQRYAEQLRTRAE
jgi:RNA polymerase sigma-70 factor, ECF subfamily